jgi:hypothetical protein
MEQDETAVLLSAVSSLAPFVAPDRVNRTLRCALVALLETEAVPEPVREARPSRPARKHRDRNRDRGSGNLEAWAPLRARVLAELAARGMSRRELGAAVKIAHGTLKPVLLPHGRAPGAANIAKLRRWLARQKADEPRAPPAESAACVPEGGSNGLKRDGPLPPYKLTAAQRERLAGYRELDERTVRKAAGVTAEVVDEAVAGKSLAPEIIGRLVGFLEQQPSG